MIDAFFAIGFLLCALCGRDGLIISLSAFFALYLANETGLHMIYCNSITAIVLFYAVNVIKQHKIKYIVFALAAVNLCATVDYFVNYITWFYICYPWFIMLINTMLIIEVFKHGGRSQNIITNIDSFIFHVKSRYQHLKIKASA